MTRPTLQYLANSLAHARHLFPVGEFYRHQSSGDVYEITGHSIRESDGQPQIEYRPIKYDGLERVSLGQSPLSEIKFSRPETEWDEIVEWDDAGTPRGGQRFIRVRKQESWVNV